MFPIVKQEFTSSFKSIKAILLDSFSDDHVHLHSIVFDEASGTACWC